VVHRTGAGGVGRGGRRARGFRARLGRPQRPAERETVAQSPFGKVNGVGESLPSSSSPPRAGQAGRHHLDLPRDGIGAYSYRNVVNVVNAVNGMDALLAATYGGQHDGPPRRARPREEGEEEGQGGRSEAARGAEPGEETPLRRVEEGVAAQPPERGGRREGPSAAGASIMTLRRSVVGSGLGEDFSVRAT
jgi:hypothetical protein